MKKVSIIIPIYNTKSELHKCLESICNQTYRNLEIICIDDGSSDGSENILDEFAKKDERIIAIHQVNSGESNARNTGLKIASGDYIAFCDCDDWLDVDMYEKMVEVMEENDVDLVASGWYKEENDVGTLEIKNELPVTNGVIDKKTFLKYLYIRDAYRAFAYMWNKLYRREIVKDKHGKVLLFDEKLKLGGDVLWLAEVALNVKKVKFIDKAFYHYNQRSSSGCHTTDVQKLRDWLRAYEKVIQRFEEEKVETYIIEYVKRFLAYHSSNAAQIAYEQNEKDALIMFQAFMRQYEAEYMSLNLQYPERINRYKKILAYGNKGENEYEMAE